MFLPGSWRRPKVKNEIPIRFFFVIHSVAPPIAGFTKNIPIFKNPLVQIPLDFFLPRIETKPSALQDICSMKNKNRGCFETFLAL